eukprot:COSAG06_NODE_2540_length_6706_cov_9.446647_9_plen_35_part_00
MRSQGKFRGTVVAGDTENKQQVQKRSLFDAVLYY